MNKRKMRMAALVLAVCLSGTVQAAYTFTDLSTLGGTVSQGRAINNLGQVAGTAWTTGDIGSHATVWNGTTTIDLTPGIPGWSSVANGINISGQVAGNSVVQFSTWEWAWRASVWNGTTVTVLGTLADTTANGAEAINSSGQVAGVSIIGSYSGSYHATVWNGTTPTDLGIESQAFAINDAGQVAGWRNTMGDLGGAGTHATVWNGITATDLGTLGGTQSMARAINNAGLVAGESNIIGDAATHATVWNGTTAIDLGTLGGTISGASAINNAGIVVGYSSTLGNGAAHATLWQGTIATDLNTFLDANAISDGWILNYANGINDSGLIVGTAFNSVTSIYHAFLLTPVPEPETYAMMLAGLGLVSFVARRRKQAAI
jgi:probable HAF family extracellular repeat protein